MILFPVGYFRPGFFLPGYFGGSPAGAPSGLTYTVKRSTAPTGPWTPLATGLTGTTYTDPMTPADDGITYYYQVIAVSPGGAGTPAVVSVATACRIRFDNCHPSREATVCASPAREATTCQTPVRVLH